MTYGLDSGGNPEVIPQLTYKAFKSFHESHYHPSNTRFFFWGDDPEEQRFALLEPYLSRFTARETDSAVPLQPRLDVPRQLEFPYASGEDGDKGHVTLNWLTCETADTGELLVLEMLEHILLGLPGSPLRKALIESGLGEDLTGGGLETDLRQTFFSVGLRSITPGTAEDVEMLIMETLAELAENGIPAAAVEAAVNSVEFDLRENNSGRFPRGLAAMIRSLATWLYDGDPIAPLAWEKPLAALKARLASGEKVFEGAIKRWFLDNEHRSTVILTPDSGLAAEREAAEAAKLQRIYDALSDEDHKEIVACTEALRASQQAPDSPEALAAIPSLTLADLPRENVILPKEEGKAGDLAILAHDIDTSGILYAEILFPLDAVPTELLPLVPLMGRSLTEMGTSKRDFVELGTLLASKTGGKMARALTEQAAWTPRPSSPPCAAPGCPSPSSASAARPRRTRPTTCSRSWPKSSPTPTSTTRSVSPRWCWRNAPASSSRSSPPGTARSSPACARPTALPGRSAKPSAASPTLKPSGPCPSAWSATGTACARISKSCAASS